MKKLAVIAVAVITSVSAFGQGQIFFNNRVLGAGGVVAPIYGVNPAAPTARLSGNATTNGGTINYAGVPLAGGTNFTAQLWYGPAGSAEAALQAVTAAPGTVQFRTQATLQGFITPNVSAATLNGIAFDSTAALQVRVWDNRGGTINSWAEALARSQTDPTYATGFSDIFTSPVLVAPPNTPPNMVGLQSFSLTVVPEPSVIALGALALGALLLRRRKS